MSFFDLISELRAKDARPEKAARVMKILALICIIGGIWNYFVVLIAPFDKMPFKIDPAYPTVALITGLLLGGLFYLASRGIADKASWGKRLGQLAVALFIAAIVTGFLVVISGFMSNFPMPPAPFLIIFFLIFFAQLVVPAFFGIQYLGRLPVDENSYVRPEKRPDNVMRAPTKSIERERPKTVERYKEAPVPFGVMGTFAILLGVPMVGIMFAERYANPALMGLLFAVTFLTVFLGPVLYNRTSSGFERERSAMASYTGGGSMFMFNGSWPFFRLLVYDDGVEVRVMFHRFFIPYDKMEDLPEKIGFFSTGILFKSDLPGVPSSIRFSGFGIKKILEFVKAQRDRFIARNAGQVATLSEMTSRPVS